MNTSAVCLRDFRCSAAPRAAGKAFSTIKHIHDNCSLVYRLQSAKTQSVTKEEIAAAIMQDAMYSGRLKGRTAFRIAKEVRNEETSAEVRKRIPVVFSPLRLPH